jgi:hypothetical protein
LLPFRNRCLSYDHAECTAGSFLNGPDADGVNKDGVIPDGVNTGGVTADGRMKAVVLEFVTNDSDGLTDLESPTGVSGRVDLGIPGLSARPAVDFLAGLEGLSVDENLPARFLVGLGD